MKGKKRSIGFSFAWNGIKTAVKTERNFKSHILAAIFVCISGLFFQLSKIEWVVILLVIGLVLVTELINTAIEKMIDYLKPDIHPSAKAIKDIAAGAVLIAAITAVLIGLIIFIPKIYTLF
ncbi:diacylglycerol kinase family protein [Virgibacillus profundi]|uniref:diacylglycerol kinase family protein n=1 Tax=Virgibacillus profundi TaxID=2024555 RepID=UPI001F0B4F96|nr:diacylglycerol kinase family protein [Virgibacillus profundi]